MRHSDQERPGSGTTGTGGQDAPRPVPHPRRAATERALRWPDPLRAPGFARFLRPPVPGDVRPGDVRPGGDTAVGQDASPGGDEQAQARATPAGIAESSAAELRELTELADLLAELAGLVHDLSGLIVGLVTSAAGNGESPERTFTVPPDLAELVRSHQELKAEQQALSARFEAARSHQDRSALRGSLATLTDRATRAVAVAAAAVAPEEVPPPHTPGASAAEPGPGSRDTSREETGVQSTPGGTTPRTRREATPGETVAGTAGEATPGGMTSGAPGEATPVSAWRAGASAPGRPRLAPVAVALDAPDIDVAAHWATLVTPHVSTVKIGLELYLRYGPAVVATVRGGSGVQVFLDLKLHDIPNTVAAAARAVAKLRPEILTVHAAGGADMIKAAVEAAPDTIVAGVTLLTSIGDKDLAELGVAGTVSDAVRRMASLAVAAGARGLVCSPQEVAAVRAEVGPGILLITPGIRPAGATADDQARVATPEEAVKVGADLLVIGRPITKSPDPGAAAAAIAASLRRAAPAPH